MSLPKPNSQATVVITGASSGIGTELAKGLARRGYPLLLVARRRERLDELADELRAQYSVGVDVHATRPVRSRIPRKAGRAAAQRADRRFVQQRRLRHQRGVPRRCRSSAKAKRSCSIR